MQQLGAVPRTTTTKSLILVAILCLFLIVYFFQSARVAIDPADLEELIVHSRSESVITDAKQRTYVNMVLFLQAGMGLAFIMFPFMIALYRNQALLKRLRQRASTFHFQKKKTITGAKPVGHNAEDCFLKRLLAIYPLLTPADLKLCWLLHQNHSSKEIASELNITPGSVNTARYRLRKKLGLPKETDLVIYLKKLA